ncbi:MAG: SDR family oxidoreductase [Rickettsiales bacterium]|jgi:3-oxoacyl-[acyl-carrier protein] reductase|nr:SDR family oxidoreductase [Rickettsiales bacterium]
MSIFSLDGKVALVTGASGVIGGAVARAMYENGATVVLNGRNTEKLNALKENLTNGGGVQTSLSSQEAHTVALSLMDVDATKKLVKSATELTGKNIDILVNVAGLHQLKVFGKISKDLLYNIMNINFTIPFILCQEVMPAMVQNKFGRIINFSSVAAHGAAGQAHYNSSKSAVEGLTCSLASNENFVKNGVTINAIAPGIIDSDMSKMIRGKAKERNLMMIPMERFGRPEEVAGAAVFLASNAASYINGQIIRVDGGMVR